MPIRRSVWVTLVCDVCEREQRDVHPNNLFWDGWQWRRYLQMPGYKFYALTCSDTCRQKWESEHLTALFLVHDGLLDMATAFLSGDIPTEFDNYPVNHDKTFFYRLWARGKIDEA